MEECLGTKLFEAARSFFSFLFLEEDEEKPLNERSYIFLTRKGFALWQAWASCGLLGSKIPDSKTLISDRNWIKKTVAERKSFTEGRHVFIVDDSVITGHSVMSVYLDLDIKLCKSRNVVCMSAGESFTMYDSFASFKYFDTLSINERFDQTTRIMLALYKLAIPFTSELPVYHIERADIKLLDKLMSLNREKDGWQYEKADLDFGGMGKVDNTFLIHAPALNKPAENIFFRGMRVCYRLLEREAEITILPWVMFDVLDYGKTIAYLKKHATGEQWLMNQLNSGETNRKRRVVHRVISYLLASCVYNDFKREVSAEFTPYTVNGGTLESYHFSDELLGNIYALINAGCDITGGSACPYGSLLMDADKHNSLIDCLLGTQLAEAEIPDEPYDVNQLGSLLYEARARSVDETSGLLLKPKPRVRYPILFCEGENKGVKILEYVRSSIASFHSAMLSVGDELYLSNVLVSGEGSPLVLVKIYEFFWGLHYLLQHGHYRPGIEKEFKEYWISEGSNDDGDDLILGFKNTSPALWPSRRELLKRGLNLEKSMRIARQFIEAN
jgi:hypothetical protein